MSDSTVLVAICRDMSYEPGDKWPRDEFLQWEVEGNEVPDGRGQFYQDDAERIVAAFNAWNDPVALAARIAELERESWR